MPIFNRSVGAAGPDIFSVLPRLILLAAGTTMRRRPKHRPAKVSSYAFPGFRLRSCGSTQRLSTSKSQCLGVAFQ